MHAKYLQANSHINEILNSRSDTVALWQDVACICTNPITRLLTCTHKKDDMLLLCVGFHFLYIMFGLFKKFKVIIHAVSFSKMFKRKLTKPEKCSNSFKKMMHTYWKNQSELSKMTQFLEKWMKDICSLGLYVLLKTDF